MTSLEVLSRKAQVLDSLIDEVEAMSRQGISLVVMFDLDDTLLSTERRHIRILREYSKQPTVRARHLEEAWKLTQIEPCLLRYSIAETAERAGVTSPEVLSELRDFWFERFFSNDYVKDDEALPGASEYCRDLLTSGATLVYLTGRDESMREGTLESLSRNGFPLPGSGEVVLILKPCFDMPDLEFKTRAMERISEMGPVAAGFDNEPAHVHLLWESFPSARIVYLETKHSGKSPEPNPLICRIGDFIRR
jgi:hypothetical protein